MPQVTESGTFNQGARCTVWQLDSNHLALNIKTGSISHAWLRKKNWNHFWCTALEVGTKMPIICDKDQLTAVELDCSKKSSKPSASGEDREIWNWLGSLLMTCP